MKASPTVPRALQSLEGASIKGRPDAPVAIILFSDFECPYCGVFAREILPQLDASYIESGKVMLAFRHFPVDSIHRFAQSAAEAAACADRQGKFWALHDQLFARPTPRLDEDTLRAGAAEIGLSVPAFDECRAGPSKEQIARDKGLARSLGLTATPTFLLGRVLPGGVRVSRIITGIRPVDQFKKALDDQISTAAQ